MSHDDFFERAERDMFPKMEDSAMNISIWSGKIDAKLAVEVGAAVLFDKPIVIAVLRGVAVPANLRRVASRIVEVDEMDAKGVAALRTAISDVLENDARAKNNPERERQQSQPSSDTGKSVSKKETN